MAAVLNFFKWLRFKQIAISLHVLSRINNPHLIELATIVAYLDVPFCFGTIESVLYEK